jgi:hypothetical protein
MPFAAVGKHGGSTPRELCGGHPQYGSGADREKLDRKCSLNLFEKVDLVEVGAERKYVAHRGSLSILAPEIPPLAVAAHMVVMDYLSHLEARQRQVQSAIFRSFIAR